MTRLRHARQEDGFALASALLIMMIVSLLGIAVLQTVTVESHQSGHEVADEAAFNLAESALDAESLQVQDTWPSSTGSAIYPTSCTQNTTQIAHCPGPSFTSAFNAKYAGASFGSPVWNVQVIDDTGGASYYSDSLAANPTRYDANGDGRLWLRAQATVWGQQETVVAQVVRQYESVSVPQATITSGGVSTENNGNKIVIEAVDKSSGITGPVNLRCGTSSTRPAINDPCAGWDDGKGQLDPSGAYQAGYTDPTGGYATLSQLALAQLKATAQANGTYYNGACPSSLTGLIFVDNANCSYTGGTWNSLDAPGALVFGSGTLTFNGNVVYDGVIYMADGQGTMPPSGPCTSAQQNAVMTVHGGGTVNGSIFVDKCGTVDAGERKFDVNYNSNASGGLKVYATPALAKNTFRIIPHG